MWQESGDDTQQPRANMTDVVFRIQCTHLPVDHASALASAICLHAPQLAELPHSGIHPIHVAGSQNGWERPESGSELLILSKRTRLRVRINTGRELELIDQLCGVTLDVDGLAMTIVSGQARPLEPVATLFSRYTFFRDLDADSDENDFVDRVIDHCGKSGFSPTKVLCGREQHIRTDTVRQKTRSVLLADVPLEHSVLQQDKGLGDGRTFGCGMLIPHKDTGAV